MLPRAALRGRVHVGPLLRRVLRLLRHRDEVDPPRRHSRAPRRRAVRANRAALSQMRPLMMHRILRRVLRNLLLVGLAVPRELRRLVRDPLHFARCALCGLVRRPPDRGAKSCRARSVGSSAPASPATPAFAGRGAENRRFSKLRREPHASSMRRGASWRSTSNRASRPGGSIAAGCERLSIANAAREACRGAWREDMSSRPFSVR